MFPKTSFSGDINYHQLSLDLQINRTENGSFVCVAFYYSLLAL
jgi:hypothetical protein